MEKRLAPIILFTYNRPEHTQKVLDALAENILAKQSELFIFCDGPKNEKAVEKNRQTRNVVLAEQERKRFKNVSVIISEQNKGLARSIIGGVTQIIEKYGACIVLEDDHITSKSFISYMNNALQFYEQNDRIWSISGFTYPLQYLKDYSHDIYLSYRACSHGWATWKDRWELVDWEVKDYEQLKKSLSRIRRFNRGGNDLFRMLRHQMRGERDSWAIRFCYSQSKHDMFTVYPRVSLINNIGFDGTGTHCPNKEKRIKNNFEPGYFEAMLEDIGPNRKIVKDFKRQYRVSISEALLWVKEKLEDIRQSNHGKKRKFKN